MFYSAFISSARLSSSFIASGSEDLTLKIWDIPSEFEDEEIANLHARFTEKAHDKDINSIALAPNDKLLATGSQDKTAKVGDLVYFIVQVFLLLC